MVRFGPAGNSLQFYAEGMKKSEQAPKWLHEKGLTAYEYQCGKGVTIGDSTARAIGEKAVQYGIALSLHAPYFISMASSDKEKRENSVTYIMQSLEAARNMGAKRVVFHTGGVGKMLRQDAMLCAKEILAKTISEADERGYGDIVLCPEVLGKRNQLGDVNEILEFCLMDERMIPTFDFGHINARTGGGLKIADDFEQIINKIENKLGSYRMKNLHCHFSRIQYSVGGEVRHLNYTDEGFGPEFDPFAEVIVKKDMSPIIICESAGKQSEDSVIFKNIYENLRKNLTGKTDD